MAYFDMKRGCPVSYEEAARDSLTRMQLPTIDRINVEWRMKQEYESKKQICQLTLSPPLDFSKFLSIR